MLIMGTTMGKAMHVWGRESIRNLYFPLSFAVNLKLLYSVFKERKKEIYNIALNCRNKSELEIVL